MKTKALLLAPFLLLVTALAHAATIVNAYSGSIFDDPVDIPITAVGSGNTLLVAVMFTDSSLPFVVTDNGGASPVYTQDYSQGSRGADQHVYFMRRSNITDAPTQVSIDPSANIIAGYLVLEVSGLINVSPVGQTNFAHGSGATPSVGVTTATANELAIVVMETLSARNLTPGTGLTEATMDPEPAFGWGLYDDNVGAAGSKTFDATISTGDAWGAYAVTYKTVPPVTIDLEVEYVDTSGVVQTTSVVDGVTTISGNAPFLMRLDASGTRSVATDGDDADGAFLNIGYHFNYGEGLGTTWAYPEGFGYSMDDDFGPPLAYRVFTNVGTNTVTLTVRDSLGNERDISFDVVVAAHTALTTVNIPVSAGSWGSLASNRTYTLDAGGDYTSFGIPDTNGLTNVIFAKTGSGADPIIAGFRPEGRNYFSSGTRSAGIRTYNIDVAFFTYGGAGFDYSGIVGGRCRTIEMAPHYFWFDNRATNGTQAEADSVRISRGGALWNCGEMNSSPYNTVMIGEGYGWGIYGVDLHHTSATQEEHVFRGVFGDTAMRYSRLRTSVPTKTWAKMQGMEMRGATNGTLPDVWTAHNLRAGDYSIGATDGLYGYPGSRWFFHASQFGASGDTNPRGIAGPEPQNNDLDGTYEGLELAGFEDCVGYRDDYVSSDDNVVHFGGRNVFVRNFRRDMGAGTYIEGDRHNERKIPPGPPSWDGPYIEENANTRPVPSTQ